MKIPLTYKLETEQYCLSLPKEADIPAIYQATKHPGFNDGMLWDPPETQEELLLPLQNNIKAWELGDGYSFTIEKKGESQLLGRISIRQVNETGIWNVGFWTHPTAQGKGVMTEALAGVLNFGFTVLSATSIEACHAIWNKASERVLQKNGFKLLAYLEQGFKKRGKWVAENKLAITRLEWEAKRK